MSFDAMKWAWDQEAPSPSAGHLLLGLAQYADEDGFCFPSQATLAMRTGIAERTVRLHLKELETAGLLSRVHRYHTDGTRTSDAIYLHLEKPGKFAKQYSPPEDLLPAKSANDALPAKSAGGTTGKKQQGYRQNLPDTNQSVNQSDEYKKETRARAKLSFDFDTGQFDNLPDELITSLQDAYPAVDAQQEVKRAALWLVANPKNRKSNYVRFLTGWLSRAQDRAPREPQKGNYYDRNERAREVVSILTGRSRAKQPEEFVSFAERLD